MQVIKTETATIVKVPSLVQHWTPEPLAGMPKEMAGLMMNSCGAFATRLSKTTIGWLEGIGFVDEENPLQEGHHVFLFEDIFGKLSAPHQDAILEHELSHIRMGHIPAKDPKQTVILDQMQYELVADYLAAKRHGREVMRAALDATLRTFAKVAVDIGHRRGKLQDKELETVEDKILADLFSNHRVTTRIRALS